VKTQSRLADQINIDRISSRRSFWSAITAQSHYRSSLVELLILFVIAVGVLQSLGLKGRIDSLTYVSAVCEAALVLIAVRIFSISSTAFWLSIGIATVTLVMSTNELLQFRDTYLHFTSVGLSDPTDLRGRLMTPPEPFVLGEWLTVLLIGAGFVIAVFISLLAMNKRKADLLWGLIWGAALVPVLALLCLACSRAVFASLVVLVIAAGALIGGYRLAKLKTVLCATALGLASIGIVLLADNAVVPGVAATYFRTDTSQRRSTEGRAIIWSRSMNIFRAHPLLGVGPGNAPFYLTAPGYNEEESSGFASRTFSLPVQILTEQGLVGVAVWCLFLGTAFWEVHRRLSDRAAPKTTQIMQAVFTATILAVLTREMTYSSLFEHHIALILFFLLLALSSQRFSEQIV
jgi:O-antigen ligase